MNDEQREFAEIISRSSEALLIVINNILDFSKIESGKLELTPEPFDLSALVYEVTELLAPQAHRDDLGLVVAFEPPTISPWVRGDPTRVRRVLTNLIGNAIKFTSDGEVAVTVAEVGHGAGLRDICISVRDTGIGIAADRLDAVFEGFTQAGGSSTRKYGGTGLGLTISKSLVEMMEGSIRAESTLGAGSTFSFQIPFEEAPRAPDFKTERAIGADVLVVDDNRASLNATAASLVALGCTVVVADSIDAGCSALADGSFDIVVADDQMLNSDGVPAPLAFALASDSSETVVVAHRKQFADGVSAGDELRKM